VSFPRGAMLLRIGCVVGWVTGPMLAMGGCVLLGLSTLPGFRHEQFLQNLMEPSFYMAGWMLYAREPLRYLWTNLDLLGGAVLVYVGVQMVLLVQAWHLRPWAIGLQVALSGSWILTGLGLPAGVLLGVGGSLALRERLDAPRARAGRRRRCPDEVSPRTPPA